MTDQHPITAPPGLAAEWVAEIYGDPVIPLSPITLKLVDRGAQWGYDQRGEVNDAELQQARDEELEACCEWLESEPDPGHVDLLRSCATALRAARRPKPPSLKKQAQQSN